MRYTSDNGIIRETPVGGIFLLIILIAVIIAAAIMIGFYTNPGGYHPAWAPEGCRVVMNHRYGNRIIIIVDNTEHFETEAECAQVILDALTMEPDFFADPSVGPAGIPRQVDIQMPGYGTFHGRFYIQYYEVRNDDFNFNVLRVVDGPVWYRNRDITLEQLREVANGQLILGFLPAEDAAGQAGNP